MKTLGGFMFITSGNKFDYCFKEAISSLCEFCDKVSVLCLDLEQDGTGRDILSLMDRYSNLEMYDIDYKLWEDTKGKIKLSHFQNIAAMPLNTDYQFLLQADEILHEDSYEWIRRAMESDAEGFLCSRLNLWGSPYRKLDVPLSRMPCSPQVIRLTKRGYMCYDDGENIGAPVSNSFVEQIRIYHMGFVRRKEVMKEKIINMQKNVFGIDHDKKLDGMDTFDWKGWFSELDLKPIGEPLPLLIQKWAEERV